ncbi:carboxymuconolactone decarboxylase family protein [Thalassomonas actiniarum]|uniref:Carboxymuconolactone decarboxylase family protein n=1 Tax=Thalassomonas actiniarum TaxID=485447 RepID=A0AAE9YQJ5_9GAMM|nr:carboxymuconolactone decarboxylase family protein [Thalassomonas actiniarum]WDD98847.1 carboxymuconolactone decarboxylase family protein [Thalassomonas actiniarum]
MSSFELHTLATAPEAAKPLLEQSVKSFGMIPNLHAVMAESPQALEAYQQLHALFMQSSFDKEELTVVWQTINVEHQCHYCVPAHTAIAHSMKIDESIITALRDESPLPSDKLETLRQTTLLMVRNRGVIDAADIEKFYAAGYQQKHLLDIVLGLSQKVMSNYVNHLAQTPVDEPFQAFSWQKQ